MFLNMITSNQSLLHQLTSDTSNTSVPSKPSTSLCSTILNLKVLNNPLHDHTYSINSFFNEDCISENDYSSFETPIVAIYIPNIKSELNFDECEITLKPSIKIEEPSNTESSSLPGIERLQNPQVPRQPTLHSLNTSLAGKQSFSVLSTATNSSSPSLSELNLLQRLVKKHHINDCTIIMSRLSYQVLDSLQQNGTVDCNVVDNQMSELGNVCIKLEPVTVDPCVCDDQVSDNLQQNLSSAVDDDDIEVPFEAIYDPVVKCEPDLVKTEPSLDFLPTQSANHVLSDNAEVYLKKEEFLNSEADLDVQPDLPELQTSPKTGNSGSNKEVDTSSSVFSALCNFESHCSSNITSHTSNQYVTVTSYQCHECSKDFKSRGGLYRHNSRVHPNKCSYKCPLCKRGFNFKKRYIAHINNHKKLKQCDACGRILSTKQTLAEHKMRIHNESLILPCVLCSTIFHTEASLKHHTQAVHSNLSYKCDICDKSFRLKSQLRAHQREVHASVRAFPCDQCKITFESKYKLKQHSPDCNSLSTLYDLSKRIRTVRSNVRAFKCHVCSQCFNLKSILTKHLIRHSDVRNHKCEQCGKQFKTKRELKIHLTRHSEIRPFACAQCHKKFKSKGELVSHLRQVHSDLRPFSCDKCSFACKSKYELYNHQLVHSNVRKFECYQCKRKYKNRQDLSVHIKTEHLNFY